MIIGDRIRLRPVERADLPRFVKWFGDPEVRDGLMFFAPIGEAQEERWFENNLSRPVAEQVFSIDAKIGAPGAGFVATSAEPNWTHIGSCGFRNIDWRNRSGELGVVIGDELQWGKGYGTDTMRTLAGWGFGELNLHRVALQVYDNNARAIRCYEKVGFKTEGRLRESNFHDGRYHDTLIMSILRAEWETR